MTVALPPSSVVLSTTICSRVPPSSPHLRRKREHAKHSSSSSLLGRLRFSYARRGSHHVQHRRHEVEEDSLKTETAATKDSTTTRSPEPNAIDHKTPQSRRHTTTVAFLVPGSTTTSSVVDRLKNKKKIALIKRFRPVLKGVLSGSLVGAKRYYVDLAPPAPAGTEDSDAEDPEDDDDDSLISTATSTTTSPGQQQPRSRLIQFSSRCLVTDIPHHSAYSPTQRQQQWNGRKAIRRRARINTLEYQHDGWDLNRASEEDAFVQVEGRWYHPAHQYTTHRFVGRTTAAAAPASSPPPRE